MKISLPKEMRNLEGFAYYIDPDDETSRQSIYAGAPGVTSRVEVPSLFEEYPVNGGNELCHVKITNLSLAGRSSGYRYLTGGYYYMTPRNWTYRQVSQRLFAQTMSRRQMVVQASIQAVTDGYQSQRHTKWQIQIRYYQSSEKDTPYYGKLPVHYTFTTMYCDVKYDGTKNSVATIHFGNAISKTSADYILAQMVKDINPKYLSDNFPSYSQCDEMIASVLRSLKMVEVKLSTYLRIPGLIEDVYASLPSKPLGSYLLMDEWNLIRLGMSQKPYGAYHLKALRQAAYLDALDHIPQLNENSLANVVELVSFIKALVIDHRIEIPKSLSSAWLAYRYTYGTTEMDAEEAIRFVHRHVDNDFLQSGFSCYGRASQTISGVEVTVKCRFDAKQKELDTLNKVWTALYRYGLSPSFYVLWDMIPYSFIVDWFVPIGDILSGYDKTHMYDRTYTLSNFWYSCSYQIHDESDVHVYTRWAAGSPPEFNGYYSLENVGTTSNKVIGFRILDALSIAFR